jgi:hypothetical protein
VIKLSADGVDHAEIAARFRRSPAYVDRVLRWAQLPGRTGLRAPSLLSAMERRVLDMRAAGLDHAEIGHRFRRGEGHIRRVEGLAHFKLAHDLLGS